MDLIFNNYYELNMTSFNIVKEKRLEVGLHATTTLCSFDIVTFSDVAHKNFHVCRAPGPWGVFELAATVAFTSR